MENSPTKTIFWSTSFGSVRERLFSTHKCQPHRRYCLASGESRFWDAGIRLPLNFCQAKKKKKGQTFFLRFCTHIQNLAGQAKGRREQYLEEEWTLPGVRGIQSRCMQRAVNQSLTIKAIEILWHPGCKRQNSCSARWVKIGTILKRCGAFIWVSIRLLQDAVWLKTVFTVQPAEVVCAGSRWNWCLRKKNPNSRLSWEEHADHKHSLVFHRDSVGH